MAYGNNYGAQQISDVYQQLLSSGTSVPDIIKGANNLGIGADQLIAAQHFNDPTQNWGTDNYIRSLYGQPAPQSSTPTPSAPIGMGGSGSGVNLNAYKQNPYLTQQADDITRRVNLSRDVGLQGIRGNAVGVGGLGGTRQGVAEGLGIGQAADNLSGQLAGLYGADYNNSMNRNLQQYGMDQQNNLGLGQLSNQKYGMDQNFYTQQRGQDQNGALLGANLYNSGTQNQFSPLTNSAGIYNDFTGFGTTNGSTSAGGGANGLLGGAIAGGQLAGNLGFGTGSFNTGGMAMTNGGGFANMPNYMIMN